MTEPDVASSDATNIATRIERDGDEYVDQRAQVVDQRRDGPALRAADPDGQDRPGRAPQRQQSMILVPLDTPGVTIERDLTVFGYHDQHGHAEVSFDAVRVPAANLMGEEGAGFAIAQARLGPGRIHHCMRMIGLSERALELMVDRVRHRTAFGRLIEFGVVTQAPNARDAAARNAEKLDRVLAELRRALPQGSQIETVVYSLNPDYRYPARGGQPTITGYTATNILRVITNDLEGIGNVIDAAIRAGANNVQSLQFTLRDEGAVRGRALREAATRARRKGDELASALNVRIVRVYQVREEYMPPVRPFMTAQVESKAADMVANTPIEPGRIEVEARVTLVLEIRD